MIVALFLVLIRIRHPCLKFVMSAKFGIGESRRRWSDYVTSPVFLIALSFAVIAHIVGFVAIQVTPGVEPSTVTRRPFVEYVSASLLDGDAALKEQASLFDAAPLFIPTKWNASRESIELGFDTVEDGFSDYLPEFNLERELKPDWIAELNAAEVAEPIDLLQPRFIRMFALLGTSGTDPIPFTQEGSIASIRIIGSNGVRSVPANEILLPLEVEPGLGTAARLLNPVRFYLLVSGDGRLISGPHMASGSGVPEFDQLVREWLLEPKVFLQLPAGYLEVEVYP